MAEMRRGQVQFMTIGIGMLVIAVIVMALGFGLWNKAYAAAFGKEDQATTTNDARLVAVVERMGKESTAEESLPYFIEKDYHLVGFDRNSDTPKAELPRECKERACLCLCRRAECDKVVSCAKYTRIDRIVADHDNSMPSKGSVKSAADGPAGEYLWLDGKVMPMVLFLRKAEISGEDVLCVAAKKDRLERDAKKGTCFT